MTEFVFREMYTLTDAIELLGHHLFAHAWTSDEHLLQKVVSPDELAKRRAPLEEKLSELSAARKGIDEKIARTLDADEISSLKKDREEVLERWEDVGWKLSGLPPLDEFTRATYESFKRYEHTRSTIVGAMYDLQLKVCDGRGQQINALVWADDPRFRFHLELSIVVNSRTAGMPRWQAVRVDKSEFVRWLATVERLIAPIRDPSVEDKLREFLLQQVTLAQRDGRRRTRAECLEAAKAKFTGLTQRLFERVWMAEAPPAWHRPGAPKGTKSSRSL